MQRDFERKRGSLRERETGNNIQCGSKYISTYFFYIKRTIILCVAGFFLFVHKKQFNWTSFLCRTESHMHE
jgi:hypothetical protein